MEDVRHDYGEDLSVRIFDDGQVTKYQFLVQAKATEHLERYRRGEREVRFPLRSSHLEQWRAYWEPVFLVVWDAIHDEFYWECVQTPEHPLRPGRAGGASLSLPSDNRLDDEGLRRIRRRTIERHERFAREQVGAQILIDLLSEALDVEISYDSQAGILFINPLRGANARILAFGRFARDLQSLEESTGLDRESVLKSAIDVYRQVSEAYQGGGALVSKDPDGKITNRWDSMDELWRFIERQQELGEQ